MCNKQPRTWIISHGLSKANAICDLEATVSASVALVRKQLEKISLNLKGVQIIDEKGGDFLGGGEMSGLSGISGV
jgi:hypothetical protein